MRLTALRPLFAALLVAGLAGSAAAQALRAEVARPLQQAGDLLRAGKPKDALAKVREADAVSGKTPQEQLMIDRMRGSAAQRAGDNGTAIAAFESAMASGRLPAGEQAQVAESLAFAYSQTRDFAKSSQWANKAQQLGSNSASLKQLQTYLQSQSGDYGAVARDAAAAVSAAEQAGRRPEETDLLRLSDAYQRTNNHAGQAAALEKLLTYYPKKDYWSVALGRLRAKPDLSERYVLDVMRLKLATGNLASADEYMEMSQLALLAGYAAEGKQIVEKGVAAGVLGTGPEAGVHKRLQDMAAKQFADSNADAAKRLAEANAAKDGNLLVQLGSVMAASGQAEQGVALITQGIAKGQLKRPEEAKLRLGLALLQTGKNKAKAQQTLRSVQGTDGAADIGRYWAILAGQQ